MEMKTKIVKIRMHKINRINIKNQRSRASITNLQVFKKIMLTNNFKIKFKTKAKMKLHKIQNSKLPTSQKIHSQTDLNTRKNKSIRTVVTHLKETKNNKKIKNLRFQKITFSRKQILLLGLNLFRMRITFLSSNYNSFKSLIS